MSKMKETIVYIGGFKMPDKNAAAHRVLNNAKVFQKLGYNIVFCGVDDDIEKDEYELSVMGEFLSAPSKYPHSNREWVKALLDFKHTKAVIEKSSNVKYVITYNMHAIPLFRLKRYCKRNNIKIIADITEWYENDFSINPKRFIMWVDTILVMRYLHKKVDGIIVISKYLNDYYQENVNKILQLPPLIDVQEEIWNQNIEKYEDTIEFVYAGNRGRNKKEKDQIGLIVHCFASLCDKYDFLLSIIGITEAHFREDYPEVEADLNRLQGKIVFRGRVSHKESIYSLYKADYSVFFRNRTRKNMAGFPTKFVEAITSGVGIIANRVSNIDDYSSCGKCEFVSSMDKEDIVSAIEHVLITQNKIIHQKKYIFDYHNYISIIKTFLEEI